MERALEWRLDEGPQMKRRCLEMYCTVGRESSLSNISDDDRESVYSIQGKETDVVQDTTDGETLSEYSSGGEDLEVELEYDVASLSGDSIGGDFPLVNYSSSGSEDLELAEGAIAAVLCDSSLERWETDDETSDTSLTEVNISFIEARPDFWTCVQCKSQNSNPPFRYCEKCFQRCWQCKIQKTYKCFPLCHECYKIRKNFFPPRPRGSRKRKLEKVNLETVKSCIRRLSGETADLKGLSQDSGLGSSQELQQLDFNQIVVPEHLVNGVASERKRSVSESSDSDIFDEIPAKRTKRNVDDDDDTLVLGSETRASRSDSGLSRDDVSKIINSGGESSTESTQSEMSGSKTDEKLIEPWGSKSNLNLAIDKELCIMCNSNPKNGIFLHGNKGHMCCCYKCALRSWKSSKRCPVCNCKVKNVVKLFTV